jgi:uncharacterized protein YdeI (YjbR/CyaY-like superfamily)
MGMETAMNSKVDAFLETTKWQEIAVRLRKILLGAGLVEEWKWAKPCYTLGGKNVAVIVTMKESCALLFMKGFALGDSQKLLERPGEHSEVGRWIKFTSGAGLKRLEPVLMAYVQEAMEAERAGVTVKAKARAALKLPEELEAALAGSAALKKAFAGLTPGRQRAYAIFIAKAKRPETRRAYVEKYRAQILQGKGIGDDARAARDARTRPG